VIKIGVGRMTETPTHQWRQSKPRWYYWSWTNSEKSTSSLNKVR